MIVEAVVKLPLRRRQVFEMSQFRRTLTPGDR